MQRPLAIVQSIATRWSKDSRGPVLATRRNAIPEVLDLPEYDLVAGPSVVAWHDVRFSEPSFSARSAARLVDLPLVRVPNLDLVPLDASSLRLDLFGKPCLRLAQGDTATVVYNFRDTETRDNWRVDVFCKVAVHVALDVSPDRLLFRRPPRETRRLLVDL